MKRGKWCCGWVSWCIIPVTVIAFVAEDMTVGCGATASANNHTFCFCCSANPQGDIKRASEAWWKQENKTVQQCEGSYLTHFPELSQRKRD